MNMNNQRLRRSRARTILNGSGCPHMELRMKAGFESLRARPVREDKKTARHQLGSCNVPKSAVSMAAVLGYDQTSASQMGEGDVSPCVTDELFESRCERAGVGPDGLLA
jgi:hypothetical protein